MKLLIKILSIQNFIYFTSSTRPSRKVFERFHEIFKGCDVLGGHKVEEDNEADNDPGPQALGYSDDALSDEMKRDEECEEPHAGDGVVHGQDVVDEPGLQLALVRNPEQHFLPFFHSAKLAILMLCEALDLARIAELLTCREFRNRLGEVY